MKVISVYNNFANTGGAQDMALRLAGSFSPDDVPVVLTRTPAERIARSYHDTADFRPLSLKYAKEIMRKWPDAVFMSHDRKSTTRLMLYKTLVLRKLKVVHVAHNVFDNLRRFTLFPEHVVAISKAVEANLKDYFRLPAERITLIPNGLSDKRVKEPRRGPGIRILLMGRICSVKRQLEIADALDGHLPEGTELYFAGRGPQERELEERLRSKHDMHFSGQIDPSKQIADYDYILLFSQKEGLPLSLIEACMYGRPMITNTLPSVLEINQPGVTGFACRDLDELKSTIRHLPVPGSEDYKAIARNARLRYEQCFTESRMLEAYRSLLEKAATGK
ncbi:MAG: glycosyltransferase family 4 protein [Muribaculaceae bacterium]|nr:glycosyltransferase family 4 protein [Muribaculaceae bacterium]